MLSRALSLAAVTFLIGCLTAGTGAAENLDAGKSPSQIFSSTCSACHKSPRGLLKTTPASSLPGFLRQHYTTGSEMARVLSGYLVSNGAADPRYQAKDQPRQRDPGRRQPAAAAPQEASRPDAEAAPPPRTSRQGRRFARPQPPEAGPDDGQAPDQSATERRSSAKQKGRRGKRVIGEPKRDQDTHGETDGAKGGNNEPAVAAPSTTASPTGESARPASEPSREEKSGSTGMSTSRDSAGSEPNPAKPDPAPSASSTPNPVPPAASATPAPAEPSSGETGSTSR